jgi:AcrR family transcriptional regulator
MNEGSSRRMGRRPGPSRTREQILRAARRRFARHGYDGTSVRAVASDAGVDPALVRRFYGSKEDLLVAALQDALLPRDEWAKALAGDFETLGLRVVGYMFEIWERPRDREVLIGMLRTATTNPRGARFLRDFIGGQLLKRLEERLGPDEAQLRATLIGSQMVGLAFYRYVLKLEPLASASPETLMHLVGPTIQRYLSEPLTLTEQKRARRS